MANILDGRAAAKAVRLRLKREIRQLRKESGKAPHTVFIQIGDNPASTTYVDLKSRHAARIGCISSIERYPESITQDELLARIAALNADADVHAMLVQLPLPKHIDPDAVVQAISPAKDVDCFHPENFGRMAMGLPGPRPATPQGVMMMLEHFGIDVAGMNAAVVGRSNLVGKPMGLMLLAANATVTYCHSRTRDLAMVTREADLLIVAAGRARLVTRDMVRHGAIVVDVGTNFDPELCGDVDFTEAEQVAGWISPVPGGVGPMTVASVLRNAVELFKLQEGLSIP